jgi:hypothetical protein
LASQKEKNQAKTQAGKMLHSPKIKKAASIQASAFYLISKNQELKVMTIIPHLEVLYLAFFQPQEFYPVMREEIKIFICLIERRNCIFDSPL